MMIIRTGYLALAFTLFAASGCSVFAVRTAKNDAAAPSRAPAMVADNPERLGALFYDGNAYAGDIAGLSPEACTLAVEKRISPEGFEQMTFEVSSKSLVKEFARNYRSSIVLSESGKALVFVGDGEKLMEHPGRDHIIELYSEKASEGDFMVKLVLDFEPLARDGYKFRQFYVSAGRATMVIKCNDLGLVR